ncbi:M20/M25/M40 family metallo-hydrolase [Nocardioides sp. GY 10113]|uniref:M20/M25/M40 family metallo-hydrolase n=1 Tax=Nocardioides sp. GY 10113 TaxID=2569761 RepID=UPI0010A92BC8|nr:M20/M25/M40 family metallo-hydrolase [Nocardioides sp. GY 10113]TIC80463.1 M20/M25/M40 family metallo-hydrolase [Nocardioides sp. GY 10113]
MTSPAVPQTSPEALHREVLEVARALIRFDTSNAPESALGRPPGEETPAAEYLRDYLAAAGVDCELVARDPRRANLVARIPGTGAAGADGQPAPSLAFVGHLDVVPADARDWTHPPFAAVVDEAGWLWGRGAIDMKNEVAARAVALAELARTGFRPRADLWFIAVADEEDGMYDVGMRWLLEARPDIRPDLAINEGGGERLPLADGRVVQTVGIGEKGTYPVRVVAHGEAGHASTPDVGNNAVPILGELLRRVGRGMPTHVPSPLVDRILAELLGEPFSDLDGGFDGGFDEAVARAARLHPVLAHTLPALAGTTMAPTLLAGSGKRNVMPARASVELDCRILPGTSAADVERAVRARLGDDLPYDLEWPEHLVAGSASTPDSDLMAAMARVLSASGDDATLLPMLGTGFTDSVYLREAGTPTAYGFSPFRATSAEVITAGFHNADERVHIDDLALAVDFHLALARELLG